MKLKSVIMDEAAVRRSMMRITHEIIEKNSGTEDLVLLGIHRRGIPLAAMLQDNFVRLGEKSIPLGSIDISLYRDDLTTLGDTPRTGQSEIPCDLTGKKVILVDDVLYTGRTVRAAIEAIFDAGRPRAIQLAASTNTSPPFTVSTSPISNPQRIRFDFPERRTRRISRSSSSS